MLDLQQTFDKAFELHKAGRLQKAEKLYRKILSTDPDHHKALHYLGLLTYQRGDKNKSVDLIKKAVAVQPDYLQAHCNLANTLVDMWRGEEAEIYCRKAIALDPEKVNAHNALAKALRIQGRYEDAIASCQKALSLNPNLDDVYETLGGALASLGQIEQAKTCYQTAIAINSNVASYYDDLGKLLCEQGQFAAAVDWFNRGLSVDPDSAFIYNNLGTVRHRIRQLEQAEENYKKAISLDDEFVMAYQNLANVQRDMGKIDEAIVTLKSLLKIAPELTTTRHNLDALLGNTTDSAPQEYVAELFDGFADQFEDHLQNKLKYNIPAVLKKALLDLGLADKKYKTVVDMGCGTGLAGLEFKDIAQTLIGIDLSKKMIHEAEKKGVYDRLEVDDLASGLDRLDAKVDLFIATDVFVYIGNLQATFAAVKKYAAAKSVFVFSTEHLDADNTFVLQNTSRYAHSKAYIESLAKEFGFHLVHFEQTNLRKEKSGWIVGGVYVLQGSA